MVAAASSDGDANTADTFNSPVIVSVNDYSGDASFLCASSNGWKVLLFGQALSFLLASGGAAQATLHFQCNLSAPTFASSIIYLLLSLNLIPLYLKERRNKLIHRSSGVNDTERDSDVIQQQQPQDSKRYSFCNVLSLEASPWAYLGIAFLDVEANYMTVLAYRYTTITSITLFDALAIPSAMILSWTFLKRRYTSIHYCGVIICMAGIVYNVLADYETDLHHTTSNVEYPNKLLGDVLAMCGGIVYGANDFLAETAVRKFGGPTEFLGMLGLFGLLISILQAFLLERHEIVEFFQQGHACSIPSGVGLLIAYAVTNTTSYVGASRFLTMSEATFLNLSFLTGDFWSLAFSVVAERIVPTPLFFVALTLTISGVVIYEIGPSPVREERIGYENVNGETELTRSLD
jgi:solute carrier family 35 protein F1/2